MIYWLATGCPLPKVKLVSSSFPARSGRDQSCAKVTQAGFAGVVRISRCEDRESMLAYGPSHVLFYLGFMLRPCLWRADIEAQRKICISFSHLPAWGGPRGWGRRLKASHSQCLTSCKARTFWMWSTAYFGKVITFSEVGQLFLNLSGHAFNAGFVLGVVKVGRFLHEKVSLLWGHVWKS